MDNDSENQEGFNIQGDALEQMEDQMNQLQELDAYVLHHYPKVHAQYTDPDIMVKEPLAIHLDSFNYKPGDLCKLGALLQFAKAHGGSVKITHSSNQDN